MESFRALHLRRALQMLQGGRDDKNWLTFQVCSHGHRAEELLYCVRAVPSVPRQLRQYQ